MPASIQTSNGRMLQKLAGFNLTFRALVKEQPLLGELLAEARSYRCKPSRDFCANAVWYGSAGRPGMKQDLRGLVGWESGQPGRLGVPAGAFRVVQAVP